MPDYMGLGGMDPDQIAKEFGLAGFGDYFTAAPSSLQQMMGSEYWDPYRQQQQQFMQGSFNRGLSGLRMSMGEGLGGIRQQAAGQGFAGFGGTQSMMQRAFQGGQQQFAGLQGTFNRGMFGLEQDILGKQATASRDYANWYNQQVMIAMGLLGTGIGGQDYEKRDIDALFTGTGTDVQRTQTLSGQTQNPNVGQGGTLSPGGWVPGGQVTDPNYWASLTYDQQVALAQLLGFRGP